jgi:hypothetical protein
MVPLKWLKGSVLLLRFPLPLKMIPMEAVILGELGMDCAPVSMTTIGRLDESNLISCAKINVWKYPLKRIKRINLPARFFIWLNLAECCINSKHFKPLVLKYWCLVDWLS